MVIHGELCLLYLGYKGNFKAISFSLDLIRKKSFHGDFKRASFDGVCSVMHNIIPQPPGVLTNLQGVLQPGIRNWPLITLIKFCFGNHQDICISIKFVNKTTKFVSHRINIHMSKNNSYLHCGCRYILTYFRSLERLIFNIYTFLTMATLINNVADYFCEVVSSLLEISDLHFIIFTKIGPHHGCSPKRFRAFPAEGNFYILPPHGCFCIQ